MKKQFLSLILFVMTLTCFAQVDPVMKKIADDLKAMNAEITIGYTKNRVGKCIDYNVIYQVDNKEDENPIHKRVLPAVEAMIDKATEFYHYETNRGNNDTLYYAMAFDKSKDGRKIEYTEREHQRIYNSGSYLYYRMAPMGRGEVLNCDLWYKSQAAPVVNATDSLDKTALINGIEKILNQKGVEKWEFTETLDSLFKPDPRQDLGSSYLETAHLTRVGDTLTTIFCSSTQGSIFKTISKEQAQNMVNQIYQYLVDSLNNQPLSSESWNYTISGTTDVDTPNFPSLVKLSKAYDPMKEKAETIEIMFFNDTKKQGLPRPSDDNYYYFGIFQSEGNRYLSKDWYYLSAYNNGEKVYHEKEQKNKRDKEVIRIKIVD